MNNQDAKEVRAIAPVVAAASETCGYCGQRRGEDDILCPNHDDFCHTWDADPNVTEAICEQKHLEAMRDGYDKLDDEQIKFANRFKRGWEDSSKRATAVDPSLLIIKEHLEDALRQLEQCTYFDPKWTYAQSKPAAQGFWQNRWTWRVIDWSAVGIVLAFVVWMFVR